MKKTIIYYTIVFVIGVVLGRYLIPPTTVNITLTSEQKELTRWKDIKNVRVKNAGEIYKKANCILANLTSFGQSSYSSKDLLIRSWGEIFGACGIEIYYKDKIVFGVTNGLFGGIGRVNIFHSGDWIRQLQLVDVQKEKSLQEIERLHKNFKSI